MIEFAKIYGEWNNYYGYNFDELAHDSLEDVNAVTKQRKKVVFERQDCFNLIILLLVTHGCLLFYRHYFRQCWL